MKRYNIDKQLTDKNKKRYFETTIYPSVNVSENDIYIITSVGDRLDIMAYNYYNDSTLWWIIALVNNIGKGTLYVEPGLQIRIPYDYNYIELKNQKENS